MNYKRFVTEYDIMSKEVSAMKTDWVDDYCLAKKGVVKEYKTEWGCHLFLVGGKFFLMQGADKSERPILSLKLDPARGDELRRQYKDTVLPGYYLNKLHWNSVYVENDFPEDLMRSMIDESYALIFGGLTKKAQKEILEADC